MGLWTAVASGDRWDRVGRASVTRKREQRRNKIEKGAAVARKRTQYGRGRMGQLPAFRRGQVQGIYLILVRESDNIHYAVRDGKWGKSKVQVQGKSLTGDRACGVICKGELVSRLETENEGYVEA